MSTTQGGGAPSLFDTLQQQSNLVNTILRRYGLHYETTKIQVDAKEKAVYYITKIYCDKEYEYVCEKLIEEYIDRAKKQKQNNIEMQNIIEENKK